MKKACGLSFLPVLSLILWLLLTPTGCGDDKKDPAGPAADGDYPYWPDDSVLGHWHLKDTNASAWFAAQQSIDIYLLVGNDRFTVLQRKDGGAVACSTTPMTRTTAVRFVPTADAQTCWYDLTVNSNLELQVVNRHIADPEVEPWTFLYERADGLPAYSLASCEPVESCRSYHLAASDDGDGEP